MSDTDRPEGFRPIGKSWRDFMPGVKPKPADNASPAQGQAAPVVPVAPAKPGPFDGGPSYLMAGGIGCAAGFLVCLVLLVGGWYVAERFGPGPGPVPAPVIDGALRVILAYDSSADMTQGQLNALNSTKVRGWLNAHCEKDSDGRAAWRAWDKDVPTKDESLAWQKAWDTAKSKLSTLPAVVVFHGEKAKAFPMPPSENELLSLLEKQGGK